MSGIDLSQYKSSEGSHIPVLIKILEMSEGPVLELGTGYNSTPLLHWLCRVSGRHLVSYESSPQFYELAGNYRRPDHEVHFIEDWDTLDTTKHWGVIFIDHAPGVRRVEEMIRLANSADYVVVHDTEEKSDWHYKYSRGFPNYKYHYDYKKGYPNTSVLSNVKDLSKLEI